MFGDSMQEHADPCGGIDIFRVINRIAADECPLEIEPHPAILAELKHRTLELTEKTAACPVTFVAKCAIGETGTNIFELTTARTEKITNRLPELMDSQHRGPIGTSTVMVKTAQEKAITALVLYSGNGATTVTD